MVRSASDVEAKVRIAMAKYWDAKHIFRQDLQGVSRFTRFNKHLRLRSIGNVKRGGRCGRRARDKDRMVVHAGVRRVQGSAVLRILSSTSSGVRGLFRRTRRFGRVDRD